jgi:hypothetical protein
MLKELEHGICICFADILIRWPMDVEAQFVAQRLALPVDVLIEAMVF